MSNSTGSEWRKWDLHFHTPSSFDYRGSATNESIVAAVKAAGISAIAVTDHHKIDVDRIRILQELAGSELAIFPGIELRSELGGSTSVHFIGIFDPQSDIGTIWTKLQGRLNLTQQDISAKGDDFVYCDFEKTAELIHELGGVVSVHGGTKSNSVEGISNAKKFKQALKKDLMIKCIDIIEVGKPEDQADYESIVFPEIKKQLPMVICSDNHEIANYTSKAPLWIKADLTLKGLKQAVVEPSDRVWIGDKPPKLVDVEQNPTKIVERIEISKLPKSTIPETWFANDIKFNSGLVAIIGNKGKGKSALADVIGLLGNVKHESFSFLSDKNFNNPKDRKGANYEAKMTWKSGDKKTAILSDKHQPSAPELMKHIPQNFLERICNSGPEEAQFDAELKKVVFSHVLDEERLGMPTLDDLLATKTRAAQDKIAVIQGEVAQLSKDLQELQRRATPQFKSTLEQSVTQKTLELEAHEKTRPAEVIPPAQDPAEVDAARATVEQIEKIKSDRLAMAERIGSAQKEITSETSRVTAATNILGQIDILQRSKSTFEKAVSKDLGSIGLSVEDLLKIEIDNTPVLTAKIAAEEKKRLLEVTIAPNDPTNLVGQLKSLDESLLKLQGELSGPNKRYQEFTNALEAWTRKRSEIVGDSSKPDSLSFYQAELAALAALPVQIGECEGRLFEKSVDIYGEISNLANAYRDLYGAVQKFIDEEPIAKKMGLSFQVSIKNSNFIDGFFALISHTPAGTFCGVEEGQRAMREMLQGADFETEAGVKALIRSVMEACTSDKRMTPPAACDIRSLIKKGREPHELYRLIFSLDYLQPRYVLQLGKKELHELSPGERGTLLLVFYLLVDQSKVPLVIDQPEENLDNQTVFSILVPCIKKAKQKRQIFMVTHNPNLAVVCDAEQIICAQLDKQNGYKMVYSSGSIEDPDINQLVLDILEGTRPAFKNRESKYQALS